MRFNFVDERGRTTNGEIGPVTDQIYETWNFINFEELEESPNCVYIPNIDC